MPAPLARGLIFSLSLLIAAGIAVYENPQVRDWLDDSRRKIALTLHNLGDDIHPRPSLSRSRSSHDASTHEDDSPEAMERRRLAREEIVKRAKVLEERRRAKAAEAGSGASFDELVDTDGNLHEKREAATTATETVQGGEGLRKRHAEPAGAAMGAALANPFGDEMGMSFTDEKTEEPAQEDQPSRESTATLAADRAEPLVIDTDLASAHESELLVDLTPTTSAAPSTFHDYTPDTPSSESGQSVGSEVHVPDSHSSTNFQAVHDWAESSNASFYSAAGSEASGVDVDTRSNFSTGTPSVAGSIEHISGDERSETGDITPGSWTEVGSVVSEEGV